MGMLILLLTAFASAPSCLSLIRAASLRSDSLYLNPQSSSCPKTMTLFRLNSGTIVFGVLLLLQVAGVGLLMYRLYSRRTGTIDKVEPSSLTKIGRRRLRLLD